MNKPLLYYAICSGLISGFILFQTSIIAPSVFKNLDHKSIRMFLRDIFPKLFFSISVIGTISMIILLIFGTKFNIQYFISIFSVIGSVFCLLIIPATNNATDLGNKKLFSLLHRISVLTTITILMLNLFWIIFI